MPDSLIDEYRERWSDTTSIPHRARYSTVDGFRRKRSSKYISSDRRPAESNRKMWFVLRAWTLIPSTIHSLCPTRRFYSSIAMRPIRQARQITQLGDQIMLLWLGLERSRWPVLIGSDGLPCSRQAVVDNRQSAVDQDLEWWCRIYF